ncbi:MAG TPA: choice-of-anchor D domain-containing protein [Actinomycetota bacterium]|nr:choice-of-anchor D domain-containing protein [Actinomycetota bacterium]
MTEKRNFWQTVPGVVTGAATILTAVVALIPLFTGGDSNPGSQASQSSSSPSPSETATTSRPTGATTSGNGQTAPRAVIAPKTINFGRVGTGRTVTQAVTIANTGTEYLVVDAAEVTGRTEVFSAEGEECLQQTGIAPASECEIQVTFTPTAPGAYAGFLEIEHTADNSPERVALNGEAALLGL